MDNKLQIDVYYWRIEFKDKKSINTTREIGDRLRAVKKDLKRFDELITCLPLARDYRVADIANTVNIAQEKAEQEAMYKPMPKVKEFTRQELAERKEEIEKCREIMKKINNK